MRRLLIGLAVQFVAVGISGCEVSQSGEKPGVGRQCRPRWIYPGGFLREDVYLEPTDQCPADGCIVNHYRGDLILSPLEGDLRPEQVEACGEACGWTGIDDRIYCTCKCGVSAGGDPDSVTCPSCPSGFECCPIERGVGDYCVRRGTCAGLPDGGGGRRTSEIDLLVMVDSSHSMQEEQASLTTHLPWMITTLTSPSDDDGDGEPDYAPASSLHIGVISSDMGTAGYAVTTCDNAERGDDGVLQNLPSPSVADCDATYPRFLTYEADAPDENIALDFECIATIGTDGCGFEQQLAAVEKAVTVHAAAGAANDGFLRPDALLGILLVTDEEDCSVADPRIFGDGAALGPMSLRCFNNQEMVRPMDEFVASILNVKPGSPDRIVVAGIVGVPTDLVVLSEDRLLSDDIMTTEDFNDILDDTRMQEQVDYSPEGGGNRLIPSCDVPGLGIAFPPRRIVELIRDVDREGNNGIVQSICQADWTSTMRAITRLLQSRIGSSECGDGVAEEGEQCDGDEFAENLASCEAWGFDGGTLRCRVNCSPSFFGCRLDDL